MNAIPLTILLLVPIFLVRSQLAYRWLMRMVDEVLKERLAALDENRPARLDYNCIPSYEGILFDLTCWTYEKARKGMKEIA